MEPGGSSGVIRDHPGYPYSDILGEWLQALVHGSGQDQNRNFVDVFGVFESYLYLEGCGSYDENMEPGGSSGVFRDHPGYPPALLPSFS